MISRCVGDLFYRTFKRVKESGLVKVCSTSLHHEAVFSMNYLNGKIPKELGGHRSCSLVIIELNFLFVFPFKVKNWCTCVYIYTGMYMCFYICPCVYIFYIYR